MHFIAVITDKKLKAAYKIYVCGFSFFSLLFFSPPSDKPLYGLKKFVSKLKKPAQHISCSHCSVVELSNGWGFRK